MYFTLFGYTLPVLVFVAMITGVCVCIGLYLILKKTDPLYNCKLHTDKKCAHVDGPLCDFPQCSMLQNYLKEETKDKVEKIKEKLITNSDRKYPCNIAFTFKDGKYLYEPAADITAYELALLVKFLHVALAIPRFDKELWVTENNMLRHFKKEIENV